MRSAPQDVKVFGVQDRRSRDAARLPWVVRWSADGRQRSKAFRTKAEGERYRFALLQAQHHGDRFDDQTGVPVSWRPATNDLPVQVWARRWLAEQWAEWQPRTRDSAVEALARFIPLVAADNAAAAPPALRAHLSATLRPGADVRAGDPTERWLGRWCLRLGQLDRARLAVVDQQLGVGDNGQPLSAWTASRYRKVSRACIRRAVELDVLPADPWPPAPQGRARRKAVRTRKAVDVRALPDPSTMAKALAAIVTHQPASRMYQAMTAVAYYAGLRPSEVVMLRASCVDLPPTGWGTIEVREADISFDQPGEPKTGPRSVPIPPQLVLVLRRWLDARDLGRDDLLFRTRSGGRPSASNWARAWKRALRGVGHDPLRVYDCRHAAATTWLRAGVPLGEVAARMGHSVETLVSTYVGALEGDRAIANQRIDSVLAASLAS
jgi:integrase